MPELLKICIGIAVTIWGALIIGLLLEIQMFIERITPLWLWIFSATIMTGGVYLLITEI